jgi:hypothetical protein
MVAKDARAKMYCKLATFGVFHQAFREIERLLQMTSPTFFRIRKMPLIADRVVGHAPGKSIQLAKSSFFRRQFCPAADPCNTEKILRSVFVRHPSPLDPPLLHGS